MAISKPDQLDFAEDLYNELAPRNKEILYRLFNHHSDSLDYRPITKDTYTQDQLRKILASELENETRSILEQYKRLKRQNVRTNPAIEYLAEHYDIEASNLDISTRFELLLLLYEENLIEELEELIIRSSIRSYTATRSYVLDEHLDYAGIHNKLGDFHQKWNKKQKNPKPLKVEKEFGSEHLAVFKIYQETTEQYPEIFAFREDEDTDEIPEEPELTQTSYHQLKTIRFQLERRDQETHIVFTEPFTQWRRTLSAFFATVFDVDDALDRLEERESEVAKELENEIVASVEEGEDPISRTQETLDKRRSVAVDNIDRLDIPETRKTDLKDRIKTIEISGSEIVDDQSLETQEFRLIAVLDRLFDSVDGIERGFRDMIQKAESDNQAFVLTISNRPLQFSDGNWTSIGTGQLPDRDRRALEIFFDGDT